MCVSCREKGGGVGSRAYGAGFRSRSEQAPGSVFHPRDESAKNYGDFLGAFWCNIKVDPKR